MVTVELLLLGIAVGMTLLAYMVAINAHGPTRLSLSYLIATVMLAATVWAIVEYVNTNQDAKKSQVLQQRIEAEKKMAEEKILSQQELYKQNLEKVNVASKLTAFASKGNILATSIINVNLQDRALEMNVLMGRAAEARKNAESMKTELNGLSENQTYFSEINGVLTEAVQLLIESANFYRSYYHAEDSEQEALRERLMRQKARAASEKFLSATSMIALKSK